MAPSLHPAQAAAPSLSEFTAMEHLVGVVQGLSMARSLDEIQRIVRHAARELTGADGATFVLRDGDQCFYADEDAIAPLWKGRRFPMTACISGWAMLHRQSVVIEDIYQDPRIPVDAYRPTFVRSLAMVPIRTQQPIGAIGTYWASCHRLSQPDLRILEALANSTSIAIENVALLDQLRAAKSVAEESCRLKDEFLSTISHELRTPLTPILAWSELMLMEALSGPALREAVEAIRDNAALQLRHVEDLLDMSRMLAGTLQLQRAPTDLAIAARDVATALSTDAAAKGVRMDVACGPGDWLVYADAHRLRQALGHLLGNALKFTPSGGSVSVRLARTPTHVTLSVTDTGVGIPNEFAPHLFEAFRQADGSATRAVNGMGLGLALVARILDLHGGTVHAESLGQGRGATFTVALPRTRPAQEG